MPAKIPQHAHEEQTFLSRVGAVALRLKTQAKLGLSQGSARRHLEYHQSTIVDSGSLPVNKAPEGYTHGDNWRSWEQGQTSLSSKKLFRILEAAFGPMPAGRRRPPFPKSDAMIAKRFEKLRSDLRSRDSESRHLLDLAIETFRKVQTTGEKLIVGRPDAAGFQWNLPAEMHNIRLANAFDALVYFRHFYRICRVPTSLAIPDIERLLRRTCDLGHSR